MFSPARLSDGRDYLARLSSQHFKNLSECEVRLHNRSERALSRLVLGRLRKSALGGLIAVGIVIAMAALFSTYLARAIKSLAQTVQGFPEATLEWRPAFRLREVSLVARRMREAGTKAIATRTESRRRSLILT